MLRRTKSSVCTSHITWSQSRGINLSRGIADYDDVIFHRTGNYLNNFKPWQGGLSILHHGGGMSMGYLFGRGYVQGICPGGNALHRTFSPWTFPPRRRTFPPPKRLSGQLSASHSAGLSLTFRALRICLLTWHIPLPFDGYTTFPPCHWSSQGSIQTSVTRLDWHEIAVGQLRPIQSLSLGW